MTPNPALVKSVEQLGYRVTVGDVAAQAGLEVNLAQQGLLALAADAGGHLQVAESGDIAYLFPKNFRAILRNKYWRLRLQEGWQKAWGVLFYLIRISFGIVLILSILLMLAAIAVIFISMSSSSDDRSEGSDSRSGGGGFIFFPRIWGPDLFWWFDPDYRSSRRARRQQTADPERQMSFLEAVFSFLFGDGNPNADLEERRWQALGATIRNNGGAIAAEQAAPYLDEVNPTDENEDYILPVLVRFNGYPQVSDAGQIVYAFPELQVTASDRHLQPLSPYLEERPWRFSAASTGQILLSIGLGAVNIVLALVLYSLLQSPEIAQLGGIVGFVNSIYGLLLGYGTAFLTIPVIRHFWIQWKNPQIAGRNQQRLERTEVLHDPDVALRHKIAYARQFASQNQIGREDLTYTTETDLLEQNLQNADKIDREWQQRLDSGS
jgi:hypothetical protein